jgi:hypothetical protein
MSRLCASARQHPGFLRSLGRRSENGATLRFSRRRLTPRGVFRRELRAAEKAAHLLATRTIADGVWTDRPRLPRETRIAFIRRILLDQTEPIEASNGETAGT